MGNSEQWVSVLRTVLKIVGAIAVAKGVGDPAGWTSVTNDIVSIVGLGMGVAGVVMSWKAHAPVAKS